MTELVDLLPIINQVGVGAAVLITLFVVRKFIKPLNEISNNHLVHIEKSISEIKNLAVGNGLQLGSINETLKDIRQIMREKS